MCITAKNIRAFRDDAKGTSTLEFVFIFPLFFLMFAMALESGFFTTQKIFLERSVDLSVRKLRIGKLSSTDAYNTLKNEICKNAGPVRNCYESLKLEMRVVDPSTANFSLGTRQCVERGPDNEDVGPASGFTMGSHNDIMFVRACLVVDPLFSATPLTPSFELDPSGGFFLSTFAAYAVEPDENDFEDANGGT